MLSHNQAPKLKECKGNYKKQILAKIRKNGLASVWSSPVLFQWVGECADLYKQFTQRFQCWSSTESLFFTRATSVEVR